MGHSGHPDAAALGFEFFDFAMGRRDKREEMDKQLTTRILHPGSEVFHEPWLEEFRKPAFYGDFVNQDVFLPNQIEMIPAGFRIALPTKEIAAIWSERK